jgi:tRNA A22 N-methylase
MKHEFKIIPKEEVLANRSNAYEFINLDKQETLEEFANKAYPFYGDVELREAIELGAKWQQEQDKNKYSEEEVQNILIEYVKTNPTKPYRVVNWFEQFKKK